jgi:hypothetical protein
VSASKLIALATAIVFVVCGVVASIVAAEGVTPDVTTAGYNTLRDNWDPNEPALSPTAVQSASFGKLFQTQLSGAIYAQPLVVGGTVIVTTEKANAYGVNPTTGAIEWSRSFGKPFKASTIGCSDLKPYIGSTSTPVADPSTGTLYLTTRLQTGRGLAGSHWYLQAISASTGEERPGFPVQIAGTPSNTPGIPFNESYSMQRPGLLLLNGVVYMAFASDCDITPYRGIVAGFNAKTGALTTMWSDESGVGTSENSQAGIWQSGGGLVSNAPNRIILSTGNGVSPSPAPSGSPPPTLSESVLGLAVGSNGQLAPTQFFSPSNAPTLDQNDEDLGSGGPVALPGEYFGTVAHPHLLVQVGKDGRIFLIDSDNMGGFRQGAGKSDAVLQTLGPFDGVWGHPAVYGGQGGWVYVLESSGGGYLRALSYGVNGQGLPELSDAGQSAESFGYTSGSPLLTSNGTTAGSAVVWVVYTRSSSEEAAEKGTGAQLRAYASTPTNSTLPLLWSAPIGTASKFSVPTAYNGRVYVGTRSGRLIAFGSSSTAPLRAAPLEAGAVSVGQSSTLALPLASSENLTITGPITAGGEEAVPGPTTTDGPRGRAASRRKTAPAPKPRQKRQRVQHTAGPKAPPPSGTAPVAAGVFTVQQPAVGSTISAGGTLPLHVTFTPARPGPVVGLLSIPTNAGTQTVSVSGYGTAPGLLVSAPPLAFGSINTRAGGKALSVTFSNSWDRPETITGYDQPSAPYSVSGLPPVGSVLAPRQAVTASVSFDPTTAGTYPSTLQIATDGGSVSLPISGSAVTGFARLAISARSIDAGTVAVGAARAVSFEVGNTGTVPLTISRAIAPIGAFTAEEPVPEGLIIEPGTFLHQTVTFRPTNRGPASGLYRFNSDTGQGYVSIAFRGRGR